MGTPQGHLRARRRRAAGKAQARKVKETENKAIARLAALHRDARSRGSALTMAKPLYEAVDYRPRTETESMSEQLKPCPFCGKEPTRRNSVQLLPTKPDDYVYCETETCPIERKPISIPEWNTRAAASAQPATEWVSVGERLPEADNVEFWWTRKESNTVEKRTFWKCNSEYYLKEFSAWMPFHKRPEPFTPKEKQQ